MGMAKLNVWVTDMDDPCKISERTWYVTIYCCDGTVLTHCGQRFLLMPAPCGHLETYVPPGTYLIKAVWSYHIIGSGQYRVNHFTDAGVVHACCDENACVTLFNPHAHRCGTIYALAVNDLVQHGAVPQTMAQPALDGIAAINTAIVPTQLKFETAHLAEIDQVLRGMAAGG